MWRIPKPSFCSENEIQFTNYTNILHKSQRNIEWILISVTFHYGTNNNIIALAFTQLIFMKNLLGSRKFAKSFT